MAARAEKPLEKKRRENSRALNKDSEEEDPVRQLKLKIHSFKIPGPEI
jgi:hypothetical protein